jgi:hypothetical protein
MERDNEATCVIAMLRRSLSLSSQAVCFASAPFAITICYNLLQHPLWPGISAAAVGEGRSLESDEGHNPAPMQSGRQSGFLLSLSSDHRQDER